MAVNLHPDNPAPHGRSPARAVLALRVLALTALAAALVLAGIVGYQLWYTNLQAENAQAGLAADFSQRLQAAADAPPATAAYRPESLQLAPIVVPTQLDDLESAGLAGRDLTAEPVAAGVPTAEERPPLIVEEAPEIGEPIGRIVIPDAAIDWVVVEGSRTQDLSKGAGHIAWTPMPGQPGNAVISGHRTTYGAPFRDLDVVEPGDTIIVTTAIGDHTYQVVETMSVNPQDTWVTDQWRGAWLTLTTCDPPLSAAKRLVVIARLVDGPNAPAVLGV